MNRRIPPRSQSGIAVVSAMLLAALVVSVSVAILFEQQRFLNRLESHQSLTQGRWMAEASMHWSRAILAEDAKGGQVDHLKENWAVRLPATPYEGGKIGGSIIDAQRYCNLNNVARGGPAGPDAQFMRRLVSLAGGEAGMVDALIDWIDADSAVTYPGGAEDDHYLALPVPYRAANRPLAAVGELSRVQGYTDEIIRHLAEYCVALPEPTPVNVNTASPELLAALLPELTPYQVQTLILARESKPIASIGELSALLDLKQLTISEDRVSVGSRYFLVNSQTQYGNSTIRLETLLKRDGDGWPQVIWRRFR